jgi:hypothetical protein
MENPNCKSPLIETLKRLSHDIDFKNFDKKITELSPKKGRGWFFKFFRGSDGFLMQQCNYCQFGLA